MAPHLVPESTTRAGFVKFHQQQSESCTVEVVGKPGDIAYFFVFWLFQARFNQYQIQPCLPQKHRLQ